MENRGFRIVDRDKVVGLDRVDSKGNYSLTSRVSAKVYKTEDGATKALNRVTEMISLVKPILVIEPI